MSCRNVIVSFHGLYEPEADLIIQGRCGDCGQELWRRSYWKKNTVKMTDSLLAEQAGRDAASDKAAVDRHNCKPDC